MCSDVLLGLFNGDITVDKILASEEKEICIPKGGNVKACYPTEKVKAFVKKYEQFARAVEAMSKESFEDTDDEYDYDDYDY